MLERNLPRLLRPLLTVSSISTTPTFAHTLLNSSTYSNVTGGQVVELQAVGSNVIVTSGLKMQSKVVTAVSRD